VNSAPVNACNTSSDRRRVGQESRGGVVPSSAQFPLKLSSRQSRRARRLSSGFPPRERCSSAAFHPSAPQASSMLAWTSCCGFRTSSASRRFDGLPLSRFSAGLTRIEMCRGWPALEHPLFRLQLPTLALNVSFPCPRLPLQIAPGYTSACARSTRDCDASTIRIERRVPIYCDSHPA